MPTPESIQEELFKLTALVYDAEKRRDVETIYSYLAADYKGVDPSGEWIDKAIMMDRYRNPDFVLSRLELNDITFAVASDSALESGSMALAGSFGEHQFQGNYRYSHFWILRMGKWQILWSQMTPILS
jgi:hypothetical protein